MPWDKECEWSVRHRQSLTRSQQGGNFKLHRRSRTFGDSLVLLDWSPHQAGCWKQAEQSSVHRADATVRIYSSAGRTAPCPPRFESPVTDSNAALGLSAVELICPE